MTLQVKRAPRLTRLWWVHSMDEHYYVRLRDRYRPAQTRLIFIAESPPASGKYFYDQTGRVTEPLFRALIRDVMGLSVAYKAEGLRAFQEEGFTLLDATYVPVNEGMSDKEREKAVLSGYTRLSQEVMALSPAKTTPLVLIKTNVCRLLEPRLLQDGFVVKNKGVIVPFPSSGQQRRFREAMKRVIG